MPHRWRDADDRRTERRQAPVVRTDRAHALSDWISASEKDRHELLIDDRRFMARGPVIVSERASPKKADAERFEVPAIRQYERGPPNGILCVVTHRVELDLPHRRADVRRRAHDRDR